MGVNTSIIPPKMFTSIWISSDKEIERVNIHDGISFTEKLDKVGPVDNRPSTD